MKNENQIMKNCPCCGGKSEIYSAQYSGMVGIRCPKCGLETKLFKSVKQAIAHWNRRY